MTLTLDVTGKNYIGLFRPRARRIKNEMTLTIDVTGKKLHWLISSSRATEKKLDDVNTRRYRKIYIGLFHSRARRRKNEMTLTLDVTGTKLHWLISFSGATEKK